MDVLPDIFEATQKAVVHQYEDMPFGPVATCIVADEKGITIAHAGDCRLDRYDPTLQRGCDLLTRDHISENIFEMERLKPFFQAGHFMPIDVGGMSFMDPTKTRLTYKMPDGSCSYNYLHPTRGFGDPDFRPAFTHVPEIKFVAIHPIEEVLFAMCSDGGNKTVIEAFTHLKQHIGIVNFDHVVNCVKSFLPDHPRDDITIILFRFSPTV